MPRCVLTCSFGKVLPLMAPPSLSSTDPKSRSFCSSSSRSLLASPCKTLLPCPAINSLIESPVRSSSIFTCASPAWVFSSPFASSEAPLFTGNSLDNFNAPFVGYCRRAICDALLPIARRPLQGDHEGPWPGLFMKQTQTLESKDSSHLCRCLTC